MTDQEGETTGTPTTRTTADPRPAAIAMMVGNVIGAVGLILGFVRLSAGGAEAIKPVALLAVGILGVVSFVRHSILHASDAARMKWDLGGRTRQLPDRGRPGQPRLGTCRDRRGALDWGTYASRPDPGIWPLPALRGLDPPADLFVGAVGRAPFGRAGSTDHDNEPADAVLRVRGPRGSLIRSAARPSGGRGFVIIQSSGMCGRRYRSGEDMPAFMWGQRRASEPS